MNTFRINYIPDLLNDSCFTVVISRDESILPYDKDEVIQLTRIIQEDNPGHTIYVKLGLLFKESIIYQKFPPISPNEDICLNPYKGKSIIYANIFDEIDFISEIEIKIT